MGFAYNIGLYLFFLLARIASLSNPKAKKWLLGRKNQFDTIRQKVAATDRPVWVHCASLGEFEQGRPLIEAIKRKFPEKKVLLTFYSPSGFEVKKDYSGADYVFYLPLDTKRNARRFVGIVNPEIAFFIKYEYWYNILKELNKNNIPAYFVSAIFRTDQLFFKWYGGWYRKMLKMATHFFVQNKQSANLLEALGVSNYTISGDTRFDRVAHFTSNVKPIIHVEKFIDGSKIIIAGSTWKAEEALLWQFLRKTPELKAIIVPHEVENGSVDRLVAQYGDKALKYSQLGNSSIIGKQVLVVDCYGVLPTLYQYGNIALVGGGFGVGIHNILEPATFGMPIIFGPNYHRFKEAIDLVEQNCAFPVNNVEEFNTVMNHLIQNKKTSQKISELTSDYVKANIGATKKIVEYVF